jgi:hypothetical protein
MMASLHHLQGRRQKGPRTVFAFIPLYVWALPLQIAFETYMEVQFCPWQIASSIHLLCSHIPLLRPRQLLQYRRMEPFLQLEAAQEPMTISKYQALHWRIYHRA